MRAARDEAGIDVRVIRGDEEARLIYLGARGSLDLGKRRVALFDLGGGSLEVILADAQELYFTASLKLGVIRAGRELPVRRSADLARAGDPGRAGPRDAGPGRVPPARHGLRLRGLHLGHRLGAGQRAARRSRRARRQDDHPAAGAWRRSSSGSGRRRSPRAARSPGSTPAAPTRSSPARSSTGPPSSCAAPKRRPCARPRCARGSSPNTSPATAPDPAGRRVPGPAAAHDHGAGPPLSVPRGPRHPGGPAGAVDLRSDRDGCTGWTRATPSCSSTRPCCTTSASTSRRTATTGTAPT